MKLSRWCPLVASIGAIFLNTVSTPALANDNWWFDVEVIAFKRNVALTELEEQFSLADNLSAPRAQADIISDIISPDISYLKQGLAVCGADTTVKWPNEALFNLPQIDLPAARSLYSSTFDTEENLTPAPNAETIAGYWASFFGVKHSTPIQVPEFKYCEEEKPWLSAEFTTLASATAVVNDDVSDSEASSEALQPAIVWKAHYPDNRMPAPADLPIIVEGHDWPLASKAHLLTSNEQALSSISRQIRSNRDLERLFHATWRQPVMFGKNNAFKVRLFGGQNYAQQYNLSGEMRKDIQTSATDNGLNENPQFGYDATASLTTETGTTFNTTNTAANNAQISANVPNAQGVQGMSDGSKSSNVASELVAVQDLFTALERRLEKPKPIAFNAFKALDGPLIVEQGEDGAGDGALRTPIWEIDGTIKVFLKYINRVPYLHVDSEMFYRQPVPLSYFSSEDDSTVENTAPPEYRLVSVPLVEQRRIISTQLHYFDHPLFGFVVQVRRYQRPSTGDDE